MVVISWLSRILNNMTIMSQTDEVDSVAWVSDHYRLVTAHVIRYTKQSKVYTVNIWPKAQQSSFIPLIHNVVWHCACMFKLWCKLDFLLCPILWLELCIHWHYKKDYKLNLLNYDYALLLLLQLLSYWTTPPCKQAWDTSVIIEMELGRMGIMLHTVWLCDANPGHFYVQINYGL